MEKQKYKHVLSHSYCCKANKKEQKRFDFKLSLIDQKDENYKALATEKSRVLDFVD